MYFLHLICRLAEVDGVSSELWEAGTEGVQEIEHGDSVELIGGFSDASRGTELLTRFAAYRPDWVQKPDTDWVLETQAEWPPREIGASIFLAPVWFDGNTPPGRMRIVHNPGTASGTGEHPCTQLVLEAIERVPLKGARVLDIGTGSGILAIAALRLGASFACGVDTDADALETARGNCELNKFAPSLVAGSADCLASDWADVVIANISGTVLLALFDELLRVARPGAKLILSGFTEYELRSFLQLLPGGEITSRNEWRCVSSQV